MKTIFKMLMLGAVVGLVSAVRPCQAQSPLSVNSSRDFRIKNTNDTPGMVIIKGTGGSNDLFDIYVGSTKKFGIMQSGAITGLTLTNQVTVNGTNTGGVTSGQTNADLTASLPMWSDSAQRPATKTIAAALTALGIQRGTATNGANLTVTNAFGTVYSGVPTVTVNTATTNKVSVSSVTVSNCIFAADATNLTFGYISIGAP